VRVDGTQMLTDADAAAAIHHLPVPGVLLYAERGLMNEPSAMYDADRVAGLRIPALVVPDTNHYTILLTDAGAGAVAERIVRSATA
jgi:hypothetical protein